MATKSLIDDSWYKRPANVPYRVASGGVVCRVEAGQVLVALVREGHFQSFVLPKGGVEAGESLEATAQREVLEEAGLFGLRLIRKLGVLERLAYSKRVWQIVHLFLFITRQRDGQPTDSMRHHGVWWFPIAHLPDMFWPEQRHLLDHNRDIIIDDVRAAWEVSLPTAE